MTLSGIVIDLRFAQPLNALLPMLVIPSGTTTSPPGPLYFINLPSLSITNSFSFDRSAVLLLFSFILVRLCPILLRGAKKESPRRMTLNMRQY